MKILILGGTGAIGKSLVEILAKEQNEVYITSRQNKESKNKNIFYLNGNAHNIEFLNKILKENYYDVIIDFMVYSENEFKKNFEILMKSTKQYIFLSSSRVYAESEIITEESERLLDITKDLEYLKTDEYALSKARQENILKNTKISNWTIVRPYITYNDERIQLGVYEKENWLYRYQQGKKIVFPRQLLEKITTLTSGEDVARIIAKLVGDNKAYNQVYQIASPNFLKWSDVINIYSEILLKITGKKLEIEVIDNFEGMKKILNCKYQFEYDRDYNRKFDDSKLKNILKDGNWIFLKEGASKCLNKFLTDKKKYQRINWAYEGYSDRLTKENTEIKRIPGLKNKILYLLCKYFPEGFFTLRSLKNIIKR